MQYRYLLAGALATSAAAFSNTTNTEPQTVTEIGSTIHTVITITSCEDHKCNEKTVPATHSIVTKTIDSVETVYTTLCPIETGEQTQPAPAPAPTGEQGQPPAEGEKTTEGQPPAPHSTAPAPAPAAPENNNNSQPPAPAPTSAAEETKAPAPAPAPAAPENNNNKSQPPAPAPTSAAEETKAPAPAPTGNASQGPAPHSTAPGEQGPAPLTTATTVAGPEKSAPVQQQQSSAPGVPEVSGALEGAANANKLGFAMGAIGLIAALL